MLVFFSVVSAVYIFFVVVVAVFASAVARVFVCFLILSAFDLRSLTTKASPASTTH